LVFLNQKDNKDPSATIVYRTPIGVNTMALSLSQKLDTTARSSIAFYPRSQTTAAGFDQSYYKMPVEFILPNILGKELTMLKREET
jgi:hypothetical protein